MTKQESVNHIAITKNPCQKLIQSMQGYDQYML